MEEVIIIGAGASGLATAAELLKKTNIKPIILDQNPHIGGMSASHEANGNYADIGGHRFFTKFSQIKSWWLEYLPLDNQANDSFLTRPRISRIYYRKKFFDYPVSLNFKTIRQLGLFSMTKIFFSYICAQIRPIKPEKTAEDFLINTFGKELYQTFFKDYTEKLWGVSCGQISAEWGKERIRGINLWQAVWSFFKSLTQSPHIDTFWYPKKGPNQFWQKVADEIILKGGKIVLNAHVTKINTEKNRIVSLEYTDFSQKSHTLRCDKLISSMPIQDLLQRLPAVPEHIQKISDQLPYRHFRSAVILLQKKLSLPDTWIYVQEPYVKMGRIQIYNNWSSEMVQNEQQTYLAFEYFCGDNDHFWTMSDDDFTNFSVSEAEKLNMISASDVIFKKSYRIEKAYPAYFGAYSQFSEIKKYLDLYENLYPIGRNGLHKYINIDHAILSGIAAADNIAQNMTDKDNIWNIDTSKFLD